ncbi:MAG: hypothetical protein J7J72_04395 [Bacteroidales bacterium]|nr:hypothetical protein [Bacteroidales bacterium]
MDAFYELELETGEVISPLIYSKKDLVKYRINRAKDIFEDAQILAEHKTINRLYYAAYYAVMALLLNSDLKPITHNGTKSNFSKYFIKTNVTSQCNNTSKMFNVKSDQ